MKNMKKLILQILCLEPKKKIPFLNEKHSIEPDLPISLSTASTSSSDLRPQTPMGVSDLRGIFRTLEPVWYYHSSLLPPNHQHQEWLRFDDYNQRSLETSFLNAKPACTLQKTPFGPCSIQLTSQSATTTTRHSTIGFPPTKNVSMPTLRPHANHGVRSLEITKDVRRVISPVWWFEQDSADGSKGMCCFDEKNQIRLEALSDGRNKLVLSDNAFHGAFTVVLEPPSTQRELKEEVRGFFYFESTTEHPTSTSKKDRFLMEGFVDDMEEHWYPSRRYSI